MPLRPLTNFAIREFCQNEPNFNGIQEKNYLK